MCWYACCANQGRTAHSESAQCVWLAAQACYCTSKLNCSPNLSPVVCACAENNKDCGGSKGILPLIRNVLGGTNSSSLDGWPLAFSGRCCVCEKWMERRLIVERAQRRRPPGMWSEYWRSQALGKPHYTFRGVLFSLSPDSWTVKLFADQ